MTITQRLCVKAVTEWRVVIAKGLLSLIKKKRERAACGVVDPPIVGDIFRFTTKYNLSGHLVQTDGGERKGSFGRIKNIFKKMR